jgi:endonuclease/exonuclease/phosphatase family metal-dependent hydrolase
MSIKITTWNIAWMHKLLNGSERSARGGRLTDPDDIANLAKQRAQIARQIELMDPDVLCIQEGPSMRSMDKLEAFCNADLAGKWTLVPRADDGSYRPPGIQSICFLVKTVRWDELQPTMLPRDTWIAATEEESRIDVRLADSGEHKESWPIDNPLWMERREAGQEKLARIEQELRDEFGIDENADDEEEAPNIPAGEHTHYRWPQVLTCTRDGHQFDIIGAHLKSKFVQQSLVRAAARLKQKEKPTRSDRRKIREFELLAINNRMKISTEATNIRYFVDNRFRNEPNPAVFLVGDLNDGIGKEYFERRYLLHDLVSNLQGDVFFANRFLNHALFDYAPAGEQTMRWSAEFNDVWDPHRSDRILLDHIMFTQGVVGADAFHNTGMRVRSKAGFVEHKHHVAANRVFRPGEGETSDHRPVSVIVDTSDDPIA